MKDPQIKQLVLDQLEKSPIVELACKKAGISRMTFYRWMKEDKAFKKQAGEFMASSRDTYNDIAESQIITAMKNGNIGASRFFLTHNHPIYKKAGKSDAEAEVMELTPEEAKLVKELAKLINKAPPKP